MSNDGLAVASTGTTTAPGMYEEIEQGDEVARGHVQVKEIIAYDFVERRKVIERDKVGNEIGSKWVIIENGRKPYFCQTKEQELIFLENNPGVREEDSNSGVRTESFSVQLLKSTAIKYMNDPRNMKEFMRPVQEDVLGDALIGCLGGTEKPESDSNYPSTDEPKESFTEPVSAITSVVPEQETEQTWRQQAKKLGIPLNKETGGSRKKEDVLTDIIAQTTTSTN